MRAAAQDPTTAALHEWRKRVKDLWYHERLVVELWAPVLTAHAQETRRLSELLGDEHDLAVLAELLVAHPALRGDPTAGAEQLPGVIEARRAELRDDAFALGARVYADRPKAFGRRLGRWIEATR
jgi:hypothetical protein